MENKILRLSARTHTDFKQTFGRPLGDYFSPITGFDVVRLDEDLLVPDGVSCRDHIAAKYGNKAVSLIETLINT